VTDREQDTLPENDEETADDEQSVLAENEAAEDATPHEAGAEPVAEEASLAWADATAALALGAVPNDQIAAVIHEISGSAALRAEVASLLPVADILMNLYQTQTALSAPAAPAAAKAPAPEPQPEARPAAPPRVAARPLRPALTMPRVAPTPVIMGALTLVAVLAILWALALSDRIATRDDEIDALKRQIEQLSQSGNATTFLLSPSSSAPEAARGTVFYSIADGKVVIDVVGLEQLDEDRVYQVWVQRSGSTTWEPGPTFLVNSSGEAVQRLAGETPTFIRIAVTEEPAPGSTEPTGEFLLDGLLAGSSG
jgi:hypothetical protein